MDAAATFQRTRHIMSIYRDSSILTLLSAANSQYPICTVGDRRIRMWDILGYSVKTVPRSVTSIGHLISIYCSGGTQAPHD